METLFEAIKSNNTSKVKDLIVTNRRTVISADLDYLVRTINSAEMIYTIFNECGEEVKDHFKKRQQYILFCAIRSGKDMKIIEVILTLDKDGINSTAVVGMTPLIMAISWNRELSLIKYLLESNADVNIYTKKSSFGSFLVTNEGLTSILMALHYRRNKEIISVLIKYNANVEARNCFGQTCLHLALYFKYDEDVIDEICCKTLNYNVEDNEGLTPLCYALNELSWPNPKYVEYMGQEILLAGKCTFSESNRNLRINIRTIQMYQTDFVHKLINKGFVVNTNVFMFTLKHCDNVDLIKSLTKYVDVKCVDKNGNCVLHHVRDARLISMFVRSGVPINHKNNNGITPLMNAIVWRKSVEVVESLLFWGSDIKKLDRLFDPDQHVTLSVYGYVYDLLVLYGMSVNLKNDFINCFLPFIVKRLANFRMHVFIYERSLLGHIFLSNENVTLPPDLTINVRVNNIIKEYSSEINKMKQLMFTNDISYHNFCVKQYRSIKSKFVDEGFTMADSENIKKLFPTFFNEIIVKIKLNIKINKRKWLLRKLMSVSMFKRSERENNFAEDENSNCQYFGLDCDCMYYLGSYMNDREINCLLASAIID